MAGRNSRISHYVLHSAVVALVLWPDGLPAAQVSPTPPREGLSINNDWRCVKGDPPGDSSGLLYDLRPSESKAPASAPPENAKLFANPSSISEQSATDSASLLRNWILPTGNAFINDPARRFARPNGTPAPSPAYAQPGFDDASWKMVNLPHDWAIDGPFTTIGGGGMGRLPTASVAWYRKQLSIPVQDAAKYLRYNAAGPLPRPIQPT